MATDKIEIAIYMLEELTKIVKQNGKTPQIDLSKVEELSDKLQQASATVAESVAQMEEVSQQVRQPIKTQHRHTLDLRTSYAFISLTLSGIIIAALAYALITERRSVSTLRDNDLKYRHIKMKGEATPDRISDIEDLFNINRDNTKIHQMQTDVEEYERAIIEKATLEEQARLRQQEAEKLDNEANAIKNK